MRNLRIFDLLRSGEDAAVSNAELSRRLGVSERAVRKQIFNERREGAPILSSQHGYFLPDENPKIARYQLEAFRREQTKHSISHGTTAALAEQVLRQLGGAHGGE